jgi:hypothetical protein
MVPRQLAKVCPPSARALPQALPVALSAVFSVVRLVLLPVQRLVLPPVVWLPLLLLLPPAALL